MTPPLTRAQKILFAIFAVAIALTRFPALSLTLHDWDETLFAAAVSEYDVVPHHPHPPGYPLFVLAAKCARLFASSDFHAAQAVAAIGSMLIFPAAFLLARELRFRTSYAFGAAAMTAFLPAVWYYGGTGFSDVPALALILFACALLLRGGRSPRAYVAGALRHGARVRDPSASPADCRDPRAPRRARIASDENRRPSRGSPPEQSSFSPTSARRSSPPTFRTAI